MIQFLYFAWYNSNVELVFLVFNFNSLIELKSTVDCFSSVLVTYFNVSIGEQRNMLFKDTN